ncbi:MarR family winged helix-turn-helix transcriptional regulator [Paenibacillus radicis (ex Xue et al. 2023)]|uniref:MarR family transcriptional regulator n=1 Tax=Paenibacillus radicis (ex Xue et al. 2023) TaxID=2972489 RepID=A0ABT1YBY7_9BACL|nr:MarR family transcriptional regulator [Paenibacillus radicis (ex Xue et al. 2023)]MCR8630708.1 MarR family transcriptional regulator [Paenibacillus radicis (ex Xue et al. 2023)]
MPDKSPIMSRIGVIFLTWQRYLQKQVVPHQITLKQQYVLRKLVEKTSLNPSQIADMFYCDRPTATVIINNMERQRWVKRSKDPSNRKMVNIAITEEGLKKQASLKQAFQSGEEFDPLSCFSEEEKRQLGTLLNKLSEHLKQIKHNTE